ncbi:MAG TPA: DUF2683 family protein [Candidatus Nanoarchaeia archaeon]|nr:DUF2683 family protein [Candidatus Nanoarchaeia archaeon]
MVQAIIDIKDSTNRVINIVKAQFGLKDKSEAIDVLAAQYERQILEPQLRPEYVSTLKKIKTQKGIKFRNIEELRKMIEHA